MNKRFVILRVIPFGILGLSVLFVLVLQEVKLRSTRVQMNAIAELIANQDDELVIDNKDPWGTNFEVQNGGSNVRIISAGPDKAINTADDIVGKWHGRKKFKLKEDE